MQVLGPAQSDALGCGDLFYEVLRDSDMLRGWGETYLLLGGSRVRAGGEGAGLWRHRPSWGPGLGWRGLSPSPVDNWVSRTRVEALGPRVLGGFGQ